MILLHSAVILKMQELQGCQVHKNKGEKNTIVVHESASIHI